MEGEARIPLFVRLPAAQVHQVDRRARNLGQTKQDVVSALLAVSMDEPEGQPGDHDGADDVDILTLSGLCAWLKLDEEAVRSRVEAGEIPGRRFDEEWRFSRAAVLHWLAGSDGSPRTPAGFVGHRPG